MASVASQTVQTVWGNKTIIFILGAGILLLLGGTSFAPVVNIFLVAVIAFWALQPFKTS